MIADKHMFADKGKAQSVLKDMWLKADQLPPAYLNIQDSNETRQVYNLFQDLWNWIIILEAR